MQAGALRKRVTFQTRSAAVDSFGQQVTTWTDAFTVWASIEPLSARELFAAQAVQSEVSHKVAVRYRAELANPVAVAAMRVVYSGRWFNVQGALNIDERRRSIELLATEGLSNG